MATPQTAAKPLLQRQHTEPEKPVAYEPPDLVGRMHVEKVAGEYRVREDECLADKLQNQEFELHFGKNKDERWRGRMDIKTAKNIYLKEVEESGLLSNAELKRLTKDDKFIAHEIDRRLLEEKEVDAQRKSAVEMQDEEFARYLEAKEREKVELERKRRLERRIAQDRAAAERLQRELEEEEAQASNAVSRSSVRRNTQPSSQKAGWDIDFEVGATPGARTKEDLYKLKDAEVTRSIQLREAEEEQRKVEEERDRQIALKLQRQEAEHYKREKEERLKRREERESLRRQGGQDQEEYEVRMDVESADPNVRKKKLHAVDATGQPISSSDRHNGVVNTPQRNGSVERPRDGEQQQRRRSSQRTEGTPQRQGSDKIKKNGEPIYLQAVDATGRPVANAHGRGVRPREDSDSRDPRLIDDQRALQEQMRHVDLIGKQHESTDTRSSKKQTPGKSREVTYDTPENQPTYNNVVTNLDPTYSSIDSLPRQQQNGDHSNFDEQGNIRPAPVIQNVRRQSDDGSKKKKKWFSKKEKSK